MEEDIETLIEELTKVRPEMLNEEALKLFNTIMAVLDERDRLKKENRELEEENKRLKKNRPMRFVPSINDNKSWYSPYKKY